MTRSFGQIFVDEHPARGPASSTGPASGLIQLDCVPRRDAARVAAECARVGKVAQIAFWGAMVSFAGAGMTLLLAISDSRACGGFHRS
jgi:hypothetical protein